MHRRDRHCLPKFARLRWLASRLWLTGLPLLGAGCAFGTPVADAVFGRPPIVRAQAPDAAPPPAAVVPGPGFDAHDTPAPHLVPISLDTILHLAEDQNLQVSKAREKVNEAEGRVDLAHKKILPDVWVGAAYYKHDGGIQLEDGTLIHSSTGAMLDGVDVQSVLDLKEYAYQKVVAEQHALEDKADLSKMTYDTLLDATTTYIDLLSAQQSRAVAVQLEKDLLELLPLAEKKAEVVPGAAVEVSRIQAELGARRQNILKFAAQAAGANARLIYLLGLDPCSQLVPLDSSLIAFHLIDPHTPVCDLVGQAMSQGPGIHELEQMVALIEDSIRRSKGLSRFLPIVEVHAVDGLFGAGPGDDWKYDNRFDGYVDVKWNLTDFCTRCERRRIADAQRAQTHLAYSDLQAKLTAGVEEAHAEIMSGGPEMARGEDQVRYASLARDQSMKRLTTNADGSNPTEVLMSLQSLSIAHFNYVSAIRDYDKAQLRLMLLTGNCQAVPPGAAPVAAPAPVENLPKPRESKDLKEKK
jgi:outer membrane protein TolC